MFIALLQRIIIDVRASVDGRESDILPYSKMDAPSGLRSDPQSSIIVPASSTPTTILLQQRAGSNQMTATEARRTPVTRAFTSTFKAFLVLAIVLVVSQAWGAALQNLVNVIVPAQDIGSVLAKLLLALVLTVIGVLLVYYVLNVPLTNFISGAGV